MVGSQFPGFYRYVEVEFIELSIGNMHDQWVEMGPVLGLEDAQYGLFVECVRC